MKRTSPSAKLSSVFGAFVPLLVPWTDIWEGFSEVNKTVLSRGKQRGYPPGMLAALKQVLRSDVPYLTLSRNDEGWLPNSTENAFSAAADFPNVLVMSSGGMGHVALPLLFGSNDEGSRTEAPIDNRTYLVSYVGSRSHAPNRMRERMVDAMQQAGRSMGFETTSSYGGDWRGVMLNSRASLTPRGFGRNAFHVSETIQMGLLPIYVHLENDIAWLPYPDVFQGFGWATDVTGLPALLAELHAASDAEWRRREVLVASWRHLWTMGGMIAELGRFMLDPRHSHLRCLRSPPTSASNTAPQASPRASLMRMRAAACATRHHGASSTCN